MKRLRYGLLAIGALLAAGLASLAIAAPIPPFSGPTCAEASQLQPCLNTLIGTLNGQGQTTITSIGTFGSASGATPVTLNAMRGQVSFTGVATLVTGAVTTLTMTNSFVLANSTCFTQVLSGGAGGSAPYVSTATATAGSLAMILANGGTTATGAAQTFVIGFFCQ